jgi:hypothetical protein
MKITLDGSGARLRLDFEDADALGSFVDRWKTKQGFLVRLSEPLKLWTELTVELRQEGTSRLAAEARVVQVFGGGEGGFATAFQATEPEALDRVATDPSKTMDRDTSAPPGATSTTSGGETLGVSPAFKIRQMNVSEKMRLASKATRGERQILLRDNSPQVLMGLLANPRIEDKEVLALAKSSAASSGVLQRIAKDRRWSANYEIRLSLVKNPQTPTPLALRMLDTLREKDLRVLAKGSTVREAIRGAALRKVIKRT